MASKLIGILALAASAVARHSNTTSGSGKLNGNIDLHSALVLDDIRFVEGQREQVKSAGIPGDQFRWPGGVVPYQLGPDVLLKAPLIMQAMDEFHKKTCIKFVPRIHHKNFISIFDGEGCSSNLGMTGGPQPVSLGYGCMYKGTIVHELGHAIGLDHEHNRSDRDKYLTINWENIKQGDSGNFLLLKPDENILFTKFDYESIMIYGNKAFSKDGTSNTMVAKNGQSLLETYQKGGLSAIDVIGINKMYKCNQ